MPATPAPSRTTTSRLSSVTVPVALEPDETYTKGEIVAIVVGGLFAVPLGGLIGAALTVGLLTYLPY